VLGILTRVAALGIALDMLGAIVLVHVPNGFFVPMGIEFPMMLFAAAVALAALGPGSLSLDHAFDERRFRT
jgi:putative oxidoreductase